MQIIHSQKSSNYADSLQKRRIEFIILHYTEMEFNAAVERLCCPIASVSSHYIIRKNGDIYNLVEDEKIAWHAGKSFWKGYESLNKNSIGIEIDNLGDEVFTNKQMDSCIKLCHDLQIKYQIPSNNIIGHSDIAPDRKIDPGIFFDWDLLLDNEIGIRFTKPDPNQSNNILFTKGDKGDEITYIQQRLKYIGYNIEVNGIFDTQTNYVIRAFQAHFNQKSIWDRKGIEYFKNPDSIFAWDEHSNIILQSIA